jgi:hypothetical protein
MLILGKKKKKKISKRRFYLYENRIINKLQQE